MPKAKRASVVNIQRHPKRRVKRWTDVKISPNFGDLLNRKRLQLRMPVKELASRTGASEGSIRGFLKNRRVHFPRPFYLWALVDALGLSRDELTQAAYGGE